MALNPIVFTKKIIDSFLKYQLTSYPFEDARLNKQMKELLSVGMTKKTPLMQGPFVSLSQTFRQGCPVKKLCDEQILHPHLQVIAPYPNVYGHQEKAIRSIHQGHTTLVSTGTGSGKSECFLYPAISKALQLRDAGAPAGISTVIIYPMNALAEDQLGRLRGLLAGSGITFGMYVGKTPETQHEVSGFIMPKHSSQEEYKSKVERYQEEKRPETVHPYEEVCSREMMRTDSRQPRILLTNVKQLELLLTRGTDAELFKNATLDYLVFDEAHTFTGVIGSESACLIRRLKAFCGTPDHTVCIATSATIVDKENPDAARDFACRFFGDVPANVECVIEEYQADAWKPAGEYPSAPQNPEELLQRTLSEIEKDANTPAIKAIYSQLCGRILPDGNWQETLYDDLLTNPLASEINRILVVPRSLADLAEIVKNCIQRTVTEEEIIIYLVLGAAAQRNNRSVFRPVVHAFVRGVPGAVVTFPDGNEPKLYLSGDEKEARGDNFFPLHIFTCSTCGQHYFIHYLKDFEFSGDNPGGGEMSEGNGVYWQKGTPEEGARRVILLDKPIYAKDNNDIEDDNLAAVYFCRHCGALHEKNVAHCAGCGAVTPLVQLYVLHDSEKHPGFLTRCISCKAQNHGKGNRVIEPIREVRAVNVADVHVLAQDIIHNADRKRLLLFTDSRQDAAFQSGWMKDHARRFRLRGLMAEILKKKNKVSFGDMVYYLSERFDADEALSRALLPEVWNREPKESHPVAHEKERDAYLTIQVLRELTNTAKQRIGLEPWGRMKVSYAGLDTSSDFIQNLAAQTGCPPEDIKSGIEYILDLFRRMRVLYEPNYKLCSKYFEEGHKFIQNGYMPGKNPPPRGIKFRRDSGDGDKVHAFFGSRQNQYMQIFQKWNVPAEHLEEIMQSVWNALCELDILTSVTLLSQKDQPLPNCSGVYQINLNKIYLEKNIGYWKCNHCSRRTLRRTPQDQCMAWRCDGKLKWIKEEPDNYDLLLLDGEYSLLRPEEHTAMVPQDKRDRIEKMFKSSKDNMVNTLVCTPTLELGVDIGGLDCALMRNVPPLPANYWQRAGRAGRRNRMAVNITYCRPVSYDKAYYDDPLKMLEGKVDPPAFNLQNHILIEKHVHAAILTCLNQLAGDNSILSVEEREKVRNILKKIFPSLITHYLFDGDNIKNTIFDVSSLQEIIEKHYGQIKQYVDEVFRHSWPDGDKDAVSDQVLADVIHNTSASLHVVVKRLYRRLHWAYDEIKRLNDKRLTPGTLQEDDQAHFRRCDNLIKKFKGQLINKKKTDTVDEINTFNVLSVEGFLPGYGMDTGSVKATGEIPFTSGGGTLELPRPTAVALREYVPGNLIYANGQKFVPRQFMLAAGMEIDEKPSFLVDKEKGSIKETATFTDPASGEEAVLKTISVCDVELAHQTQISDEEENRWQMPVMVYAIEKNRHNGGVSYLWGNDAKLDFRRNVHFRMVNAGTKNSKADASLGYPICTICGQSVSPMSSDAQLKSFMERHTERCGKTPERIGFYADIISDTFMLPDCLNQTIAYSVMEAIRMGAVHVLDMHLQDLQVMTIPHFDDDKVDAYLYDPMPGGSGLLAQIIGKFQQIYESAVSFLENCSSGCETSCINCMQNYRNSFYHKYLDRHEALKFLHNHGGTLKIGHEIPPMGNTSSSVIAPGEPVNKAEQRLQAMLKKAGFMDGEWQKQIKFKHKLNSKFGSTTPDVFYPPQDPDDETEKGLCIYLDGMSEGIHGNPEALERDQIIREQLMNDGYKVICITAIELDDKKAMIGYFRRIAKFLVGRDFAREIADNTGWF